MDFFDVPIYKWRFKMNKLLSNVALSEIKIGGMSEVSFTFINTINGEYLKTLKCKNVVKLSYENALEDDFPCFISEVYSKKVSREDTHETFQHFHVGTNKLLNKDCFLLSIESGDVDIDILCESFDLLV